MSSYLVKKETGQIVTISDAISDLPLTEGKFYFNGAEQISGTIIPPGTNKNLYCGIDLELNSNYNDYISKNINFINTYNSRYGSDGRNTMTFLGAPSELALNKWFGIEFLPHSFLYGASSFFGNSERTISVYFNTLYPMVIQWKVKLISGNNEVEYEVPAFISNPFRLQLTTTTPDFKIMFAQTSGVIGRLNIVISNIQVEAGDTATEFVSGPFIKDFLKNSKVTLYHSGKNFINTVKRTQEKNGVTFEVNDDGSVYVHGTSTASTYFYLLGDNTDNDQLYLKKDIQYFLSGTPDSSNNYAIIAILDDSIKSDYGEGNNFSITSDTYVYYYIYIKKDVEIDTTFYPQLELGTSGTTYEGYKGSGHLDIELPEFGPVNGGYISSNGKIISKNVIVLFDGSSDENWIYDEEIGGYYISVPDVKNIDSGRLTCISNVGLYDETENTVGTIYITSDKKLYYIAPSICDSVESFKHWLSSFKMKVSYETELYSEIMVAPILFKTLEGENNFLCNQGNTDIAYYVEELVSPQKYLIQSDTIIGIADELRKKTYTTAPIEIEKFSDMILKLEVELPEAEEESF